MQIFRVEEFTRDGLAAAGFMGFQSFTQLRETHCSQVPTNSGVYVVLREDANAPTFLLKSPGGWFKKKDPTLPVTKLEDKWVSGAHVVYIGRSSELRSRLLDYGAFGLGSPVRHWGGRLIWQIPNSQQFTVAWQVINPPATPQSEERRLIDAFVSEYGHLPFANLNRPRSRESA
jgi:hypothetical protein